MTVKELLVIDSIQDEYEIINVMTRERHTYNDVDKIPESFNDMNVVSFEITNPEAIDEDYQDE